jgi:general stress protein YciG
VAGAFPFRALSLFKAGKADVTTTKVLARNGIRAPQGGYIKGGMPSKRKTISPSLPNSSLSDHRTLHDNNRRVNPKQKPSPQDYIPISIITAAAAEETNKEKLTIMSSNTNPANFANRPTEEVSEIGRKGGQASHSGGFASMDPDKQVR